MTSSETFDFLEIENDPHLLDFKFEKENFHMWIFIRSYVLLDLISKKYQLEYPLIAQPVLRKKDIPAYLFHTTKGFFNYFRKYDMIFFEKSAGCVVQKDGKWFNRVSDYFSSKSSSALVLDHSFNFKYKSPRFPDRVASQDFFKIIPDIFGKFFPNISKQEEQTINDFLNYIEQKIKLDQDLKTFLHSVLKRTSLRIKFSKVIYKTLFKITSPKIIFIEDASYGVESYIIKWAKEMGIKVAEIQHGMVSPLYPAYCYGTILHNKSIVSKYLPDFYLTYGTYWGEVINYPSRIIPIGNPHFSHSAQKGFENTETRQYKILIASDPCSPKKFQEIALHLVNHLPEQFQITLKLHPLESEMPDLKNARITTVKEGDIFNLLRTHKFCISSFSTVLFESISLGNRTLLFNDEITNAHIPEKIGEKFNSPEELIQLILSEKNVNFSKEEIFASKWEDNYLNFLSENVGNLNVSRR